MSAGVYTASWVTSALVDLQAEARRKDDALHQILMWAAGIYGVDPDVVLPEIRRIVREAIEVNDAV